MCYASDRLTMTAIVSSRAILWTCLACLPLWAGASHPADPGHSTAHPPAGLSGADWSSIRSEYESHRNAVQPEEGGGYRARNQAQQWITRFDGRGFTVQPDSGRWTWGLELKQYGFAGHERDVRGLARIASETERVRYVRPGLEEWFVNNGQGLEHGFTLAERPSGAAGGSLRLQLGVRGSLIPRIAPDRRGVSFVDAAGGTAVSYAGLKVWDADGKELPARFEPTGKDHALRLSVDEAGARYPLTIDPVAQQQAYLKASNTGAGDFFGRSIAISGDTVVVGADGEWGNATGVNGDESNNSAITAGAAYVFVRNGATWSQQAYLKASNTGAGDRFGFSVAISGDTIVVGAPYEAGPGNSIYAAGAAYVFSRSGSVWSQQAYLTASNTDFNDYFGYSVAISGDIVVVGATGESSSATGVNGDSANNNAYQSGAAYVFVRNSETWSQQAYLKASNTGAGDGFGSSVAISGDTVVVGVAGEDSSATGVNGDGTNNSSPNAGAAYVFVRNAASWSQQAYLKASNTGAGDGFGSSVAISGDTVVVGAFQESSNATGVNGDGSNNSSPNAGAAYVFVRNAASWSQQAYLKASNTGAGYAFGTSVAISGNTVVVGSPTENGNVAGVVNAAPQSGAAYLFTRSGTTWSQQSYLKASNAEASDNFGYSVAISGNTAVVSATGEDSSTRGVNGDATNNGAPLSGASYVFLVPAPSVSTTVDTSPSGLQIIVDGTTLTAPQTFNWVPGSTHTINTISPQGTGSRQVFLRWTDNLAQSHTITAPSSDAFYTAAFTPQNLLTLAVSPAGAGTITASPASVDGYYDYGTMVVLTATPAAGFRFMGYSGSLTGTPDPAFVLLSTPRTVTATFASVTTPSSVQQQAYVKAFNTGAGDRFGRVALSGDTMVVGAPLEDSDGPSGQANNNAVDSGAVYVYVRSGTTWSQQAYLKASNVGAGDQFGTSVAISGDTIVVGAPLEDSNRVGGEGDNSAASAGAAYVFVRSGGTWSQQAYLKAANTAAGDQFGGAVAISGDTIVVGARFEDSSETGVSGTGVNDSAVDSGAAYVFARSGTTWNQQAYLKASNTEANDAFGVSVAISGGTIVVGAFQESSSATGVNGDQTNNNVLNSGAAYVFVWNGTAWAQQAYLKASNTGGGNGGTIFGDVFGVSVAISGDTVVVGARGEASNATGVNGDQTNNNANLSGAVYVFVRSGSAWSQQAYLKASNSEAGDSFGNTVSISGDTVAVGAALEDSNATGVNGNGADNSVISAGAAYVFRRSRGIWSELAYLKPSSTGVADNFGSDVAISGDIVAVGAFFEDSSATGVNGDATNNSAADSGAVTVFTLPAGPTTVLQPTAVSPASGSGFTQTFTFIYNAPNGFASLSVVDVLINNALDGRSACYVAFVPSTGSVFLVDDAGNAGGPFAGGLTLPGTGTAQNSQCVISGAGSSASGSGNTLTLTLNITFKPAFAGNKIMYLAAQDTSPNSSGWQTLGVWNVPGTAPAGPGVSGVSPARSTAITQTYAFTFTDTNGFADLKVANILINNALDGRGACYIAFVPSGAAAGSVFLVDDAGNAGGPYAGLTLPGTQTVQNSQCSISGAGSVVSGSGNTLTLVLNITFKPAFAGNRVFYLAARSNTLNSDWQAMGTVTVLP